MSNKPAPIGRTIEDFTVLGRELDAELHCTGADIILEIRDNDVGRWVVSVVTKKAFLNKELGEVFLASDDPGVYFEAMSNVNDAVPPYVLNDNDITDEVLERKFRNRTIEADLAETMEPLPDIDDDREII